METQPWRPNVGIAELGEHNLYHLGQDGLEPITMVMVEFRRGRSAEKRLALGRAIVDTCVDLLGVPRRTVMVEFTRMRVKRSSATETGPETGHPPRPLRAEVHMIAPSWSFSMLSWDQVSERAGPKSF